MRTHESIGLAVPDILLPRPGTDLAKWAVVACDQYTSEPEYWEKVARLVGDAPSTLHVTYPEVFLGEPSPEARIARIRETMTKYLDSGLFEELTGFVHVERTIAGGHVRHGLMACLDLEQYDFRKGSTSPIRATEGTILERIPPRVKIREGAAIELPHIMVLLDDPGDTVLGPLRDAGQAPGKTLYDLDLMLSSGHVRGTRIEDPALEAGVVRAIQALADPEEFARKTRVPAGTPVLLYAMGDGNHSLATAKTIWESTKAAAADPQAVLGSKLRWALVEIVNLHDPSLVFEAIHRVVFGLERDLIAAMREAFGDRCKVASLPSFDAVQAAVDAQTGVAHLIGVVTDAGCSVVEISEPFANLAVGTLQTFLDAFMKAGSAHELDYVHGVDAVTSLGRKPGNAGIYLPAMHKDDLFRTVVLEGALPRKTFSMGEAHEKRFYLEARRLA
ncbi:MAG: DUF1015 domain-containing protein [Deltaproteobacteria bacterium]|nr:DUF1015 domain-containing protein [Deltaproteobacteria bacterium]